MKQGKLIVALLSGLSLVAAACGSGAAGEASVGMVCEGDQCRAASVIGGSCRSDDPNHVCLGVKTIAYLEGGKAQVSQATTQSSIQAMNAIWAQCNIGFQLEQYEQVDPTRYGLATGAAAAGQTDQIRRTFEDPQHLLIVITGFWGTTKNAWTQMPGFDTHGAIFENSVADYPNIWAHEIGHYLNLDHVSDPADVMSPLIYPTSKALDAGQCEAARASAKRDWPAMLRT